MEWDGMEGIGFFSRQKDKDRSSLSVLFLCSSIFLLCLIPPTRFSCHLLLPLYLYLFCLPLWLHLETRSIPFRVSFPLVCLFPSLSSYPILFLSHTTQNIEHRTTDTLSFLQAFYSLSTFVLPTSISCPPSNGIIVITCRSNSHSDHAACSLRHILSVIRSITMSIFPTSNTACAITATIPVLISVRLEGEKESEHEGIPTLPTCATFLGNLMVNFVAEERT